MKKLGSVLLFLFFALPAFSEVKIETRLSDENLEVGQPFYVELSLISDTEMVRPGSKFKPPVVEGCDYMGTGERTSTQVNIINFKKEATYTHKTTANFTCQSEGTYVIPSVNMDVAGLRSGFKKVKVFKELPAHLKKQQRPSRKNSRSFGGLLDQFMGGVDQRLDPREAAKMEFFSEVEVDKTTVYKGEQILATWYIYISPGTSMGTFDTLKFPTLKGFWKEDVAFASRFSWRPVTKKGKRYMRALLTSYALTPYKEGVNIIDPFELRASLTKGFWSQSRRVLKVKSQPVRIKVEPLPQPQPPSYFGGVGFFKVSKGSKAKQQILLGEPYKFKFKIIGDHSNTKFIKPPKVEVGEDFLLYSSEEDYKFVPSKVSSYKDFTYNLVPKKEGVYQIPDIKVTFLNPASSPPEYYSRYIKLPLFKVLPNPKIESVKDVDFLQEQIEEVQEKEKKLELAPLGERAQLREFLYFKIPLWLHLLLWIFAVLTGVWWFKKFSQPETLQESFVKDLEERMRGVQDLLQQKKYDASLSEVINIYSIMVGAISGKRFGAEEEFSKAVKQLPSSLKAHEETLSKLNQKIQVLRFNSGLEKNEKRVKLQECLNEFQKVFVSLRSYLH